MTLTTTYMSPIPVNRSENSPCVLLLEDDPNLGLIYSRALRHAGYDVVLAISLHEARPLLRSRQHFSLVICDVELGNDRGTDILREYSIPLRQRGTRIVMISIEAGYRKTCEDLGADLFLEKPISVSALTALAKRFILKAAPG